MRFALLLVILGHACFASGQASDRHTVSGYVTDASSGETLIGATIWAESLFRAWRPMSTGSTP